MAALARWCGQPIGLTRPCRWGTAWIALLGGNAQVAVQPPDQKLADLARPQCGLSRLRETIRLSIWGHSWLA